MTIKIPLSTYLESGHELAAGDTLLCPCYPYVGKFVREEDDEYVVKMKGGGHYKTNASHSFGKDTINIPIKIQRFHILDIEDEDTKKL